MYQQSESRIVPKEVFAKTMIHSVCGKAWPTNKPKCPGCRKKK